MGDDDDCDAEPDDSQWQLGAIVVHLCRSSNDEDAIEKRRENAESHGDEVHGPVADQEIFGAVFLSLVEVEENADAERNGQRNGKY
jgi:hypothetical protein